MSVGVLRVRFRLPQSHSLKDKRQVLVPIITKVKSKYNVSVAEIDDQDLWQAATLGIACVSNSSRRANQVLSKVIDFISKGKFEVEMLDWNIEILPGP